jgi:hypothetical protein
MRKNTIGKCPVTPTKISDCLQSSVLHSIRNVVSDELVEQTCREFKGSGTFIGKGHRVSLGLMVEQGGASVRWAILGLPSSALCPLPSVLRSLSSILGLLYGTVTCRVGGLRVRWRVACPGRATDGLPSHAPCRAREEPGSRSVPRQQVRPGM